MSPPRTWGPGSPLFVPFLTEIQYRRAGPNCTQMGALPWLEPAKRPPWEKHDVGTTPPFNGNTQKALAAIKVPVLYMPSATDLYFPVGDARFESQFIPHVTLKPIPSLWGHPAGAGAGPGDLKFLNDNIAAFLRGDSLQGEAVRHVQPG